MPNQYDNQSNVLAHYETTGPEIYRTDRGRGGCLRCWDGHGRHPHGHGRVLKEQKAGLKMVGVEPTLGHAIQGLKNMHESIVPKIYDPLKLDEKLVVEDGEAFEMTRMLAQHEGSSSVCRAARPSSALSDRLRRMRKGTIVAILPDRATAT